MHDLGQKMSAFFVHGERLTNDMVRFWGIPSATLNLLIWEAKKALILWHLALGTLQVPKVSAEYLMRVHAEVTRMAIRRNAPYVTLPNLCKMEAFGRWMFVRGEEAPGAIHPNSDDAMGPFGRWTYLEASYRTVIFIVHFLDK